jgi:hypothetical protein
VGQGFQREIVLRFMYIILAEKCSHSPLPFKRKNAQNAVPVVNDTRSRLQEAVGQNVMPPSVNFLNFKYENGFKNNNNPDP